MAQKTLLVRFCTIAVAHGNVLGSMLGGVLMYASVLDAQQRPQQPQQPPVNKPVPKSVTPPTAPPAPSRRPVARLASADATMLDFVDADIRGVITAIAEAGGLNVTFSDLPSKKVSLHARRPDTREGVMALLHSVVRNNGLTMVDSSDVVSIAGLPPIPAAQANAVAVNNMQASAPQLFVYRLKHANAARLATVLQAVFAGGGISTGRGGINRPTLSQTIRQQQRDAGGNAPPPPPGQPVPAPEAEAPQMGIVVNGQAIGAEGNEGQPNNPFMQIFGGNGGGGGGNNRRRAITIVPEESTNSLLVRAAPEDWGAVKDAIDAVDLRPLQVLIEVVIAEVQRSENLDLGVKFNASNARTSNGNRVGSANLPNPQSDSTTDFIASLTRRGRIDMSVALSALQARGNVRILSRPLIFAENNIQSKLLVGSQRPFIQSFRTLETDNSARDQIVQYRDVGTSLTILPTINSDGYVNMQVQQEVSSATSEIQFGAPVISTREASASLFVKDGETVVVGGLSDTQEQNTRTGIPGLSAIPGIGGLFGSTQKSKAHTELYLFLTPHVVQSDADANRIREEIKRNSELLHTVPTTPIVTSKLDSVAVPARVP